MDAAGRLLMNFAFLLFPSGAFCKAILWPQKCCQKVVIWEGRSPVSWNFGAELSHNCGVCRFPRRCKDRIYVTV